MGAGAAAAAAAAGAAGKAPQAARVITCCRSDHSGRSGCRRRRQRRMWAAWQRRRRQQQRRRRALGGGCCRVLRGVRAAQAGWEHALAAPQADAGALHLPQVGRGQAGWVGVGRGCIYPSSTSKSHHHQKAGGSTSPGSGVIAWIVRRMSEGCAWTAVRVGRWCYGVCVGAKPPDPPHLHYMHLVSDGGGFPPHNPFGFQNTASQHPPKELPAPLGRNHPSHETAGTLLAREFTFKYPHSTSSRKANSLSPRPLCLIAALTCSARGE